MGTIRTIRSGRIATVGVVAAVLATSLIAVTGVGVAVAKSASCVGLKDDHWPAWVQGRPAGIDPHTTSAIYMWHDGDGWHIRVTHRTTNRRTFSGQLVTQGAFTGVKPVHLEKSDTFQVSRDRHDITFLFENYGAIDGLNFLTHCAPSISTTSSTTTTSMP